MLLKGAVTKLVRSRWLDILASFFVCDLVDLNSVLVHEHAKSLRSYLEQECSLTVPLTIQVNKVKFSHTTIAFSINK